MNILSCRGRKVQEDSFCVLSLCACVRRCGVLSETCSVFQAARTRTHVTTRQVLPGVVSFVAPTFTKRGPMDRPKFPRFQKVVNRRSSHSANESNLIRHARMLVRWMPQLGGGVVVARASSPDYNLNKLMLDFCMILVILAFCGLVRVLEKHVQEARV